MLVTIRCMAMRDAAATRARIFEAATAEFAAHGIAGARVDRIARSAQANKQLIYAYFGDKKSLFSKVLDKALVDAAASVSTDITDLDEWVEEHLDAYREHPELLRLLMWEALELPEGEICRGAARAQSYGVKKQKIAEAQELGIVRKDMPPSYMLMILISMIRYADALPQLRDHVLGDEYDPDVLHSLIKDGVKRVAALAAAAGQLPKLAG
jgi:AcrR family transcriptional regulator